MHYLRRSSLNQQSINSSQSPPPSTAARKASLPVWPPASSIESSQQVISNWEERHTSEFSSEQMWYRRHYNFKFLLTKSVHKQENTVQLWYNEILKHSEKMVALLGTCNV
jgi:hypothetical protein